jgi:PKHD-type hydroxylase
MLLQIPQVLTAEQVALLRSRLQSADAPWVDGRATAGYQGAPVKHNQQLEQFSAFARELGDVVLGNLERHPTFISAALPNKVYPPLFNRYGEGMTFGSHVDGAIRLMPNGTRVRTDLSATLFLSSPDEYDGGELTVEDTYGSHAVKLNAGDMVLYPATSLHRVTPITRGVRLGCFMWAESLVRSDSQRLILYNLDQAIQKLNATNGDEEARRTLVNCYHNMLREWSQT